MKGPIPSPRSSPSSRASRCSPTGALALSRHPAAKAAVRVAATATGASQPLHSNRPLLGLTVGLFWHLTGLRIRHVEVIGYRLSRSASRRGAGWRHRLRRTCSAQGATGLQSRVAPNVSTSRTADGVLRKCEEDCLHAIVVHPGCGIRACLQRVSYLCEVSTAIKVAHNHKLFPRESAYSEGSATSWLLNAEPIPLHGAHRRGVQHGHHGCQLRSRKTIDLV